MIAGAFYGPGQLPKAWLKKLNKDVRTEIEELTPRLLDLSPWGRANNEDSATGSA
jgi:hypothetical protein